MITAREYYKNHILCSDLYINQGATKIGRITGSKDWTGANNTWSVRLTHSKSHSFTTYKAALLWANLNHY